MQILRYASLNDVGDVPSGDVSVAASTKFFREKNVKDQNSLPCTKKIAYFWFPQGMIEFPGGDTATKMEFPEGRGGPFCEPILENPEGWGAHR